MDNKKLTSGGQCKYSIKDYTRADVMILKIMGGIIFLKNDLGKILSLKEIL